jgi:hypothetical protein
MIDEAGGAESSDEPGRKPEVTPRKLACALPFWLGFVVVVALLVLFYYLLFVW